MSGPLPPSAKTLAKYGLSGAEWLAILERQFGVCAICGTLPRQPVQAKGKAAPTWKGPRLCVDHEHVKGYKNLPPEKRKVFVRGLVCWHCNKHYIGRAMNLIRAEAVVRYLTAHNERVLDFAMGRTEAA